MVAIHGASPSGEKRPVEGRDLCPELDPGLLIAAAEGARFPADEPGLAAELLGIEDLRPVGVCFGARAFWGEPSPDECLFELPGGDLRLPSGSDSRSTWLLMLALRAFLAY